MYIVDLSVADPGFPVGGRAPSRLGGCQPPMWVLFGKNICENERIGSRWGGAPAVSPGSTNACTASILHQINLTQQH